MMHRTVASLLGFLLPCSIVGGQEIADINWKTFKSGNPQQVLKEIAKFQKGSVVRARNEEGMTPLMLAASNNSQPGVISILLGAGADLDARNADGLTPLMLAARDNPSTKVLSLLLAEGAAHESLDHSGRTPLMHAAGWTSNTKVISTLLNAGADVNFKNRGFRISCGKSPC